MATARLEPPVGGHVRTLRGLASYACGHTGSCCRAGWPIPIEPAPMGILRRAEASGTLPALPGTTWTRDDILCHTQENECVFHDAATAGAGCRLEGVLGPTALPSSCRQFPRILLTDARGWHQSLSTWCGSAARLIVAGGPDFLSIDHISVDPRVHLESLDASDAWPPFLRPGVLAGHDGYERWETRALQGFLGEVERSDASIAHMLASLLCWTDVLRGWRPTDGSFHVVTGRPWRHPDRSRLLRTPASTSSLRRLVFDTLLEGVDAAWRPAAWPAGLTDPTEDDTLVSRRAAENVLARYLATRLLGSWVAYQGKGLRAVASSLVSALALVALALPGGQRAPITLGQLTSSIRASDWLLLHLLDRQRWAEWCSAWEGRPDVSPLVELVAGADAILDSCMWASTSTPT